MFKFITSFFMLWLITSILLISPAAILAAATDDWVQAKDKSNILISKRPTQSGYIEVKAEMIANGQPQDFLRLLNDVKSGPLWIDNCKQITLLETPNENERIIQMLLSAPWPIKDRDMVFHSKIQLMTQDEIIIKVTDASDYIADLPNYVRMTNVNGTWQIKLIEKNKISINYQGFGEPSGAIPPWLANSLLINSTYNTFEDLRKQLSKR